MKDAKKFPTGKLSGSKIRNEAQTCKWLFLGFLTVMIVSCQSPTNGAVSTGKSTARPTSAVVFTETVKSPNGIVYATLSCFQGLMQWHCQTHFSNGHTLSGEPDDWSPDGKYALACFGDTHDSPCSGFYVWDMAAGVNVGTIWTSFYQWSPLAEHTLVYLDEQSVIGVPDDLRELNASSGEETILQECPDWFLRESQMACEASPGVSIGGEVRGLPPKSQAVIRTYALDEAGKLRGYQTIETGDGTWSQLLRRAFGQTFEVTIETYGATQVVSRPEKYVLYVDGTQVYILQDGQAKPVQSNSIDFALEEK